MRNQKTRNRHVPLPHMMRMAEQAERMQAESVRPDRNTSRVLAYMDEFNVDWETAQQLIRNDRER